MSGFGSWKAVRPSAPASDGQDPLSEAFKSAVNAFGWPDRMGNYHDSSLSSTTTTKHRPSAYLPTTPSDQSHPATPEQSGTAAIPTISHQSSSNVIGDAHQQLPSSRQIVSQGLDPREICMNALAARSTVRSTTTLPRTIQQPTSPSVDNARQGPPSKRRRVTDTGATPSETTTMSSTPVDKDQLRGAENCLSGCIFVFSGELPTLSRPDAQRLIERHGGQVVLVPNEHTTHSVLGHGVTKNKLTILDRFQIVPLDGQGLIRMVQEMPANGRWEESPVQEDQRGSARINEPRTTVGPRGETSGGSIRSQSEMPAPAEGIVHITNNDHSDQAWPFNEPPNLVRHVPRANGVQETEIFVKDESSVVDTPPQINHALRREYARSWGTPQVKRGELAKIKFAVNYEKGESRLVKHEVRRRGGKIVRISQADVLVNDRQFLSIAQDQATLRYRPEWRIQSDKFFEAFPALEVLPFEIDGEASSMTADSADQALSNGEPSGVSGNADGPTTSIRPPSLARSLPRAIDRISQAQANYEDLIAQRNACVAVRDRKLRRAERLRRDFYDSDSDETRAIEQDLNNEERTFRPPSPAVPPIMEEVASDGYASSCDEYEIHRAIIHSTKRMKPAKVKKGFLIQVKMVLRGPTGATVNAVNGKPGVTRTLRVPAVTSFRQLTDVLNTAFGWVGDGECDCHKCWQVVKCRATTMAIRRQGLEDCDTTDCRICCAR